MYTQTTKRSEPEYIGSIISKILANIPADKSRPSQQGNLDNHGNTGKGGKPA